MAKSEITESELVWRYFGSRPGGIFVEVGAAPFAISSLIAAYHPSFLADPPAVDRVAWGEPNGFD
jgi:hypothetical protein